MEKGNILEAADSTPAKKKVGRADPSVLARYRPTEEGEGTDLHPEWVRKNFPEYVAGHPAHEMEVVREFSYQEHRVRIITTYRVEVDGEPVNLHISVDADGQVHTHATPFVTYGSAVDLMKAVLGAYRESLDQLDGGHNGHREHDPNGHREHDHDGHREHKHTGESHDTQ